MPRTLASCGLLLTSLTLYHNLGDLSRGFSNFFSERPLWDLNPSARSPAFNLVGTRPLTMIVYHRPHQKSTDNVAQIRDKMRPEVCANCELTKSERCDIMEILPGAFDLGQPKTKGEAYPLPISTSTSSYPSDSNHDLWTKQVPQPHR